MTAPNRADTIGIGLDVLQTALASATGFITAQLGNVITSVATSDAAEWFFPPGFAARVRKPQPGKAAAQVVRITRSGNDAIVGTHDARDADIIGELDDGETIVFSPEGKGSALFKKDGSIVVKNGAGSGSVTVNADGSVLVGDGNAAVLADGAAFSALWNQMKSCAATLDGAATFAGAPNVPPLATFFGAHPTDKLQTTKAKGT